jgi:hypothetical protein
MTGIKDPRIRRPAATFLRTEQQVADELYRRTGNRVTKQRVGQILRQAEAKIAAALAGMRR